MKDELLFGNLDVPLLKYQPSIPLRRKERKNLQLNPIRSDNTENIQRECDGHELATRLMRRGFSCPNRRNGVEDAGADTIEHSCLIRMSAHRTPLTFDGFNSPQYIQL